MDTNFDWDNVDSGAQDQVAITFPVVMWRNGNTRLKALGDDINHTGGFFFTYEHAGDGAQIAGWKEGSFKGDREDIFGLAARKAMITIIRGRKRWVKTDGKHREFRPWNGYEAGFRAQMQMVGFIKGYDEPVSFSFKGLNVDAVEAIRREHGKLMNFVNRSAPDRSKMMPPYALWTVIEAGPHEMVGKGQQSEATPPRIVLPKDLSIEVAKKVYVGRDLLLRSQELYRELDGWATDWDRAGGSAAPEQEDADAPANDRFAQNRAAMAAQAPTQLAGEFEGAPGVDDDIPF